MTGRIETHWFENEYVNLPLTLFHRITIPFEPFDSGLDYVSQPESTELCYEWLQLDLADVAVLDGLDLSKVNYPDAEASIYLGAAHNPVDVQQFAIHSVEPRVFRVDARIDIVFEFEGVGKNERFEFNTELKMGETA